MSRRASLLAQFADLTVEADDPHRLAERTLEVVMALVNGRSGGVFAATDLFTQAQPCDDLAVLPAGPAAAGCGSSSAIPTTVTACGRRRL